MACTVALGLAVPAVASAQPAEEGRLEWIQNRLGAGFYAGISFAAFIGPGVDNSPDEFSTKASPTAGGFMTLDVSERWAFQGEAVVATKGSAFLDSSAGDQPAVTNLVYLEFPVLAKLKAEAGRFGVYGLFGFSVAAMFDGRTEDAFGLVVDVRPETNSVDAGLLFGGGVALGQPGQQRAFVELRYEGGLRNLDVNDQLERHNSVFSILAGLSM